MRGNLWCRGRLFGLAVAFFVAIPATGQQKRLERDPTLDNLVHPEGYETTPLGTLGRVREVGSGPRPMILIAGAGFGGEVFDSFMEARTEEFTMYAVILPGFGRTAAPPMPQAGTSYGDQTWTNAIRSHAPRPRSLNRKVGRRRHRPPGPGSVRRRSGPGALPATDRTRNSASPCPGAQTV